MENRAVAAAAAPVVGAGAADDVADSDVGFARRRRGGPVDGLLPLFSIGSQSSSGLKCHWNRGYHHHHHYG